jgi:hypothetical protein
VDEVSAPERAAGEVVTSGIMVEGAPSRRRGIGWKGDVVSIGYRDAEHQRRVGERSR